MNPLFLSESKYIDFSDSGILDTAHMLFQNCTNDAEKAEKAFLFVRDSIPHTFDINATVITAKASAVLQHKTGICHAKANLLAALLRAGGIPAGLCFQHLTLKKNDSLGYCVHCYNAAYIQNKWIKFDARGNKKGVNAQFSLQEPQLAFSNRKEYDEYFWPGIYALPHGDTMKMLENAKNIQDILDNIPDYVHEKPDIQD